MAPKDMRSYIYPSQPNNGRGPLYGICLNVVTGQICEAFKMKEVACYMF